MSDCNFFQLLTGDLSRKSTSISTTINELEGLDSEKIVRCSSEEARTRLSYESAQHFLALPLAIIVIGGCETINIAVANCEDEQMRRELRFLCGAEVRFINVSKDILSKAIFSAYHGSENSFQQHRDQLRSFQSKIEQVEEKHVAKRITGAVPEFLESLIAYAVTRKASDIHLLPRHDGLYIMLRIDGELRTHESAVCSLAVYKQLVSRIKILARLDITKLHTPHDGNFSLTLDASAIDVRVSIMPTIHGEKIVMRLHGCRQVVSLNALGLDEKTLDFIHLTIRDMRGLVICAGATGSGKSTTLYSMLEKVNTLSKSIITIEDPVEIQLPYASQTSIDSFAGLDYAKCLYASMRQDPDCLMVGELRDSKSAAMTFEAALTGHLVITSLHAGSVQDTFARLIALGIKQHDIAQSCSLIICQRLLPRLCQECKVFDLAGTRRIGKTIYREVGCAACDYSGYNGRVLVCESLKISRAISSLIMQSALNLDFKVLQENSANYVSLDCNSMTLLEEGKISLKYFDMLGLCD